MIDFLINLNWIALGKIIIIDILLGGDNAVVIALACKELSDKNKIKGIVFGTVGAIILRLIMLAFAIKLLDIHGLKAIGGILLIWIGAKMIVPSGGHSNIKSQNSLFGAVMTITIADVIMSLDNVIAITAAAKESNSDHQFGLAIFGILLSIPIIVWGSTLVLKLLDRFPILILVGSALLGSIAGGMFISDSFIMNMIGSDAATNPYVIYIFKIVGALLVLILGFILTKIKQSK